MLHLGVAHYSYHKKNNTHEIYSMLQGFDNMFHVIYAHEWMNDAHVHEMQVQLGKPNTRGVTTLPLIKISSRDLGYEPFVIKFFISFL